MRLPRYVFRNLAFSLILFPLILVNVGCGSNSYEVEEVKEYRLFVDTDDSAAQSEIRSLIDAFNLHSCFHALSLVSDESESNSSIKFVESLREDGGKVGWGQWQRQTYQDNPVRFGSGKKATVTYVYSMHIEFDKEYFFNRLHSEKEEERKDLFKLASHEFGHGLQMIHDEKNQSNIMYPDISGEKDLKPYFVDVRKYFNKEDACRTSN